MISSAQPSEKIAPRRPQWTSPRAPLSPTTTLLAPSSLRPQPRTKAALLQGQSCHLRATCAKHPRRRAVGLQSLPQMSCSRCRSAAADKLLSPTTLRPLPLRCCHYRQAAIAIAVKLPPRLHRRQPGAAAAPPPRCNRRRRQTAVTTTTLLPTPLLPPLPRC